MLQCLFSFSICHHIHFCLCTIFNRNDHFVWQADNGLVCLTDFAMPHTNAVGTGRFCYVSFTIFDCQNIIGTIRQFYFFHNIFIQRKLPVFFSGDGHHHNSIGCCGFLRKQQDNTPDQCKH